MSHGIEPPGADVEPTRARLMVQDGDRQCAFDVLAAQFYKAVGLGRLALEFERDDTQFRTVANMQPTSRRSSTKSVHSARCANVA